MKPSTLQHYSEIKSRERQNEMEIEQQKGITMIKAYFRKEANREKESEMC